MTRANRRFATALLLLLAGAAATPAQAQLSGDGYLFRQPTAVFSVFGGWALPRASGDVFDFVSDELTLSSGDFGAVTGGLDVAVRITPRLDLTFGFDASASREQSEYREWLGADDLPIIQDTEFSRRSLTAGLRLHLLPRGKAVSQLVWVPAAFSPWLGGGAGLTWYRFEQQGEFVDYETFDIFEDQFISDGNGPMAYLSGGVDVSLAPSWIMTLQGRYSWASSEMDRDWIGFDNIDLAGLQATVGFGFRF